MTDLSFRSVRNRTEESREKNQKELTDRMVLELLGNSGLVPFYKDIRRIVIKNMFEGQRKSEQRRKEEKEYKEYIYGSADVVGLMCLKVFVSGDEETFKKLKPSAMALGSAFQKVNFLRDLNADFHDLNRTYFPNLDFKDFDDQSKMLIMEDIENDFRKALKGIYELPNNSKFGVYAAYKYYKRLLVKLKRTSYMKIKNERVRVPNYQKVDVLARSYVRYRLNIL